MNIIFPLTNYVKEEECEWQDEPVGPHIPAGDQGNHKGENRKEYQDLLACTLVNHCLLNLYYLLLCFSYSFS